MGFLCVFRWRNDFVTRKLVDNHGDKYTSCFVKFCWYILLFLIEERPSYKPQNRCTVEFNNRNKNRQTDGPPNIQYVFLYLDQLTNQFSIQILLRLLILVCEVHLELIWFK